jgi:hypothetical protein
MLTQHLTNPKLPYPAESLHSYIARFIVMSGMLSEQDPFLPLIAGSNSTYWRPLPILSELLKHDLRATLSQQQRFDMICSSSPLYSVRAFLPPRLPLRYSNALFLKPLFGAKKIPNLPRSIQPWRYFFSRKLPIRICPDCLKENNERYGTIFFERSWYYFSACMKHKKVLLTLDNLKDFYDEKSVQKIMLRLFRGNQLKKLCTIAKTSYIKASPSISFTQEFDTIAANIPFYTPCMTLAIEEYFFDLLRDNLSKYNRNVPELDSGYFDDLAQKINTAGYYEYPNRKKDWLFYQMLRLILTYDKDAFFDFQQKISISIKHQLSKSVNAYLIGNQSSFDIPEGKSLPGLCASCVLNESNRDCRLLDYENFVNT